MKLLVQWSQLNVFLSCSGCLLSMDRILCLKVSLNPLRFFFITETDTKNDYSQELGNLQKLNDKIEENTNIAKFSSAKYVAIFVKVYNLFTIAELLILVGLSQFLSRGKI